MYAAISIDVEDTLATVLRYILFAGAVIQMVYLWASIALSDSSEDASGSLISKGESDDESSEQSTPQNTPRRPHHRARKQEKKKRR